MLKNRTVGLITPSSPLIGNRLAESIMFFERQGCIVKVGNNNTNADRFLAGSDRERAEDIMAFFCDPTVDVLIATGGGAGSMRVLPYLDYGAIQKHPKPIIGFSDTTALQLGIFSKTGNPSYTGFTCRDLTDTEVPEPHVIQSLSSYLSHKDYSLAGGTTVHTGSATAPLLGGNMSCISHLLGTKFQPNFRGKILFFEDVWLEPYVLDSLFSQFYMAGIFDEVAGVIMGQFKDCEAKFFPERDGTSQDVINEWCKKITVPCIKEFPYSHFSRRYGLPIGTNATLDATKKEIHIHFST